MNYLNQIPLVRIVLPLMMGIVFGLWLPGTLPDSLFYTLTGLTIVVLFYLSAKGSKYATAFGFGTLLLLVLIGIKLVGLHSPLSNPSYFGNYLTPNNNYIIATISEPPQEKTKSVKAILKIESINRRGTWINANGQLLTYFAIDNTATALAYGDRLLIRCNIDELKPPQNPGQFNYKNFLANKGIYHQTYLRAENYAVLESNTGNVFYAWVNKVRARLLWQLRESGLQGQELAVASALLLGYDDDIDNDLLQAYSASGTMHVLSVSGMHAGLVYVVLMWLLQFTGQTISARILRVVIIISALWVYALLTGFSPPVIRAAAMFSLLALGKSLNRYTNTINILAGSCLVMLVFNPFLLADVGFQLSYLAVFGIAVLYQPVYNWFEPKSYWVDKIWQVTAMSIVAQLATFPLGLLYFHQFPNYFLVSNLIIIPLSTIVIFMGIGLLLLSFSSAVASAIGYLLSKLIHALNWLVLHTEQLPYAVASNISISIVEMSALYCIIAALAIAFYYRKKYWLYIAMAISVVYLGGRIYRYNEVLSQQRFIVYNTNKATAIEFVSGNNSVLIADSAAMPPTVNYRFNLAASGWYYGISNRQLYTPQSTMVYYKKPLVVFGNTKLLLLNEHSDVSGISAADYIILSGSPFVNFNAIEKLHPRMVLFSNAKPQKVKYWQKEFTKLGIKCYDVNSQGAFISDN